MPVAVQNSNTRQRMWQSMRVLKRFTASEVAATAEVEIKPARNYIAALLATGFVRVATPAKRGVAGSYTVYQLIRNSGPSHPEINQVMMVHDTNIDEWFIPNTPAGERIREQLAKRTQ